MKELKLLLLEDDLLDAELNIAALEAEGYKCEWERVQTKEEFIAALKTPSYDLILIDYNLPAFDGLSALYILQDFGFEVPAMLVSGNLGEELAIDSMRAGAVDYVHKDRLNRLVPSVKRALKESKSRRVEKVQASNLALFNKLNQAANSGASIHEMIEILAIETSNYADYFGAITLLSTEDKQCFEMQYLALPVKLRKKIERLIGQSIPSIRIKLDDFRVIREVVGNDEAHFVGTDEEIEKVILNLIQAAASSNSPIPFEKLSSLIREILALKKIVFYPLSIKKCNIGILAFLYKEEIFLHDVQRMNAIAEQLTEIFARKLAEDEVEKLHQQQKMILDSVEEGILGLDTRGNITFANPSAAVMLGYTEREIKNRKSFEFFRAKENEENSPLYATYRFGENIYDGDADFLRKDGSYFPVFYSSSAIEREGEIAGAVITFRDISEQVEATREIARLAEVVEQASVSVAITDLEGTLIYVNPYFEKSTGYSVEEVLGENPRVLKSGIQNADVYEGLWETIQKGETWHDRLINKRKNGNLYYEDANIFPIKTAEGEIINYATVKRDITAQVEAEEQIRLQLSRLDSLHSIDIEILSNIDLKAILNIILEQVKKGLGVDAANILLFNPSVKSLEPVVQFGFNGNNLEDKALRLGKGLAGKTALERKRIFFKNLSKENKSTIVRPSLLDENFSSYFGLPLLAQGKLKGVLEVFHRSVLEPNMEWLKFLDMLAGQAAIAIDNISLFENLQKNNMELQLAYDTTLEGWARALELRDMETVGHSRRVTALTIELAKAMGIDQRLMDHIRRGALLHDIGKMGVPDV
ncbi:MAG: PAS domain S-box protein, partial [Anaerolineae bacterium]|nr:PAS domain S-box protein [Anaerolineae bacterium]